MTYFENTRKELMYYIDKCTDPNISDKELSEIETLYGMLDFSLTWTEDDFKTLDKYVGVKLQSNFNTDVRDVKTYFQNKVLDSVKTGVITREQMKRSKTIKKILTGVDKFLQMGDKFRCKAENYKKWFDGRYSGPGSIKSFCEVRLGYITDLTDTIAELDSKLTNEITKLMFAD
jgi:hypothetical protein